ncbi:MAG: hypothetical protein U0892_18400 [Pirellulales bacterium]
MSQVSLRGGRVQENDESAVHRISQDPVRDWEKWWVAGGELMNPILVKEVRQSLKSRQFEISFGLTLLACIGWTFLFVFTRVPMIYYVPSGAQLLAGYLMILAVPLFVVIPFTAFRSLASEIEENTYELLSISALSAKQIIQGKMATSVLQIILYLSALTPCIMLTYLMRGVALQTLLLLVGMSAAVSVLLVSGGLLVGAVGRTKVGQGGLSVLWLICLVIVFFGTMGMFMDNSFANEFGTVPPAYMLISSFAALTIGAALLALLMQTAASVIEFPSENRSTPIRRRILILLTACLFWILVLFFAVPEQNAPWELAFIFMSGMFVVFLLIGTFMCGERGLIAPRAQRSLPATFVGRLFLTWLGPGGGVGYMFIVTTYVSVVMLFFSLWLIIGAPPSRWTAVPAMITLAMYLALYLGLLRLIMLAVGRHIQVPMVAAVAFMVVLQIVLQLGPYVLVSYSVDFNTFAYGPHQMFNVPWTIERLLESDWSAVKASLILLALASMLIFGLNLMLSARDVMLLRIEAPERVKRETVTPAVSQPTPDPFAD